MVAGAKAHAAVSPSGIEVIVGLPHLAKGALLERAVALQAPVLISANCLSRWRKADGWRDWTGWRTSTLANATHLASLDLDSAGYTMTVAYGGMPWSIDDYMVRPPTGTSWVSSVGRRPPGW